MVTRNHSARAPASSRVRVAGGRAGAVRHTCENTASTGRACVVRPCAPCVWAGRCDICVSVECVAQHMRMRTQHSTIRANTAQSTAELHRAPNTGQCHCDDFLWPRCRYMYM